MVEEEQAEDEMMEKESTSSRWNHSKRPVDNVEKACVKSYEVKRPLKEKKIG